jgi:hypothetical protein
MLPSRGMGAIRPSKMPKAKTLAPRKDGDKFTEYKEGGKVKSRVNEAGNYTNPVFASQSFERMRKQVVKVVIRGNGALRKAQMLAQQYKEIWRRSS